KVGMMNNLDVHETDADPSHPDDEAARHHENARFEGVSPIDGPITRSHRGAVAAPKMRETCFPEPHRRATTDLAGGSAGCTRSMTIAASCDGVMRCSVFTAIVSIRLGDRRVSISNRY